MAPGAVAAVLEAAFAIAEPREVALCDTTGRAVPDHVERLFGDTMTARPKVDWAFHAHDTYGLGTANVLAAWRAGVQIFDASVAGLGGCPYAPGATGNVATEDIVWMFEEAGVATGISMDPLLTVALEAAALPGAQSGGRVRHALRHNGQKAPCDQKRAEM